MNRAGYEAYRLYQPARRPWFISRAGWVSQARYAWNWTGDVRTSWESLRMTVPLILGTSLSGQPYNGPDIGGFSGTPSAELYLRWFQMAAFLPFFRTHSSKHTDSREPWSFGEPYTNIIREYLQLRYRLLPYLYTLAWEASQTGHPLVRPLFWIYPREPELWQIEDQFLLGDAILVAPILEPGQMRRSLILPQGRWIYLWTDKVFHGHSRLELESGLEHIPVFIRAGSLVPMWDNKSLELHLYPPLPGHSSQQSIYSDSGDGYGTWRVDRFKITREDNTVEIDWENEGDFPLSDNPVELVLHACHVQQAWLDGKAFSFQVDRIKLPELAGTSRVIKFILQE
jgi:alpha-glucosidase